MAKASGNDVQVCTCSQELGGGIVPELIQRASDADAARIAKRDTQFGINAGSPVFLLDDPDGNTYCMKSASLITDPDQTYDSLANLGGRLKPPPAGRESASGHGVWPPFVSGRS